MSDVKRNLKDSVFTFLFSQPEYTRELYLALHPEETNVTVDDCKIVTLENILSTGQYNDLGIQVNDRLLLLVEAQSTFSENITLRMLMYLAETYKQYVEEHKLDLYAAKPVNIPKPELYVVYTGQKKDPPETLFLSGLYGGGGSAEISVTVRQDTGKSDILDQYVRFCRIADEQRELYGRSQKAIEETIRVCTEAGVLADFLASRKKEVQDIMVTLFDQATVMEIHDYNLAREKMAEGRAEGRIQGHAEGRAEEKAANMRAMIATLQSLSLSRETAVQSLIDQWGLTRQMAESQVAQHWKS